MVDTHTQNETKREYMICAKIILKKVNSTAYKATETFH